MYWLLYCASGLVHPSVLWSAKGKGLKQFAVCSVPKYGGSVCNNCKKFCAIMYMNTEKSTLNPLRNEMQKVSPCLGENIVSNIDGRFGFILFNWTCFRNFLTCKKFKI